MLPRAMRHLILLIMPTCFSSTIGEQLGVHIILEVHDAPFAALNSSDTVMAALQDAADVGGLHVVGEMKQQFPVQGFSAVLLVSESHLSIHTWPERGYAAVDLFTCGLPVQLPCKPRESIDYKRSQDSWTCSDGRVAAEGGALWSAVHAIVAGLDARGAHLTWLERGIPAALPPPARSHGWLAGLEGEHAGGALRAEL